VVKIEVRKNGQFEIGYPYNSSVDKYFQSLTEHFIKNYGLNKSTVLLINNHKNATQQFDLELHNFAIELSKFMTEFYIKCAPIINAYDKVLLDQVNLQKEKENLEKLQKTTDDEYAFISQNLDILDGDIQKTNEMIKFYQAQLVEDRYFYNDSYIADTQDALKAIQLIENSVDVDITYYNKTLVEQTLKLSEVKKALVEYSFEAVTIRTIFEEWSKRTEPFFISLVDYFKSYYSSFWTYGESLIYGKKVQNELKEMRIYETISSKWQETLIKKYNVAIDKELKQYSLEWLKSHKKFEEEEFSYQMESRKVTLLKRELDLISNIVSTKKSNLKRIVTSGQEQNYLKYREISLDKIRYTYNNVNGIIDSTILNTYDLKMKDLEQDHRVVVEKYVRDDYWNFYAEWDVYSKLSLELSRQLDVSEKAVSSKFKAPVIDNSPIISKIEFYTTEKKDLVIRHTDLMTLKEKHQLENNAKSYDISIVQSTLNEKLTMMKNLRSEYTELFKNRLSFYIQNHNDTDFDGIVKLINGKTENTFTDYFKSFIEYQCDFEWFDKVDREKLVEYYRLVIVILSENILNLWNKEFSHEILDLTKKDIYVTYFDNEIRILYAYINNLLLHEKYDPDFMQIVERQKNTTLKVFTDYLKIMFNLGLNVSVPVDVFDYFKVHEFTISSKDEQFENILKTVNDILVDKIAFAYNKNVEFKERADYIKKQEMIDKVWLDMGKKYV